MSVQADLDVGTPSARPKPHDPLAQSTATKAITLLFLCGLHVKADICSREKEREYKAGLAPSKVYI